MHHSFDLIGVGSPILDMLVRVEESFIETIRGEKGGMVLVEDEQMDDILSLIDPKQIEYSPGGAAANTTFALANLGIRTAFVGKLGTDENADFYKKSFQDVNGDISRFKSSPQKPTARCLSFITPDAERTMRTNLGAASLLSPDDISTDDFRGDRHVHIEGYLLFNRELLQTTLKKIHEAGCTISLDLGSFEIVNGAMDILPDLLRDYITIVFANEDEARAFGGSTVHEENLGKLAGLCDIAVVKVGKKGSYVREGNNLARIQPVVVDNALDTTGAGDLWASGFLYGYLSGKDIDTCGRMGSIMGAHAVQCMGTCLGSNRWEHIREEINAL
ncbi:MAG: adenosine kinase [Spirochaetota bacterium]